MSTTTLTPQERSLRARVAALALHSQVDSRAHLAPALAASPAKLDYFERKVDPDGALPAGERARRARAARSGYYANLALKSAVARRKRTERSRQRAQ
jgi:hypothetical protein